MFFRSKNLFHMFGLPTLENIVSEFALAELGYNRVPHFYVFSQCLENVAALDDVP